MSVTSAAAAWLPNVRPYGTPDVDPTTEEGPMERALIAPANRLKFILAGEVIFTIQNEATGNRFTYRVQKSEDGGIHFVGVLTGSDNMGDYSYLGCIKGDEFFRTKKSRIGADALSFKAFDWLWNKVQAGADLPKSVQIWHEGSCCRCGRRLTTPESVSKGIGPVCEGKGW